MTVSPSGVLPPGDRPTVSVTVAVAPAVAFEVFTQETDLWWRRGLRYRLAGRRPGSLSFELGPGGRLFESFETPSGTQVYEAGRVTVWQPPSRLVFTWRNANFAAEESTEVEVLFEPTHTGTRVTVQHRGWSALRPGHPARHGLDGAAFSRMMGLWWGDLMTALREFIETRGTD
jgi:uncharacterized protein YndB with AHSA1/START domain